ncbi:UNKNOWN [Stylonychia lemnae]|uniref:Uncharacterized protein n=1 Tax=Stylonychia lemnae TaxID=5949 RepID=A0A078BBK4_STYLE|nr:UNKNOWN [Stylonychia lemnae]|eukprot:CDW90943.1 UNKNOWN [Stylonychia lemnae]
MAYFEPLFKNQKEDNFIIILTNQGSNPYLINDHYMQTIHDIIKQSTGMKQHSSNEQIAKNFQKCQNEIELSFQDLMSGLDQSVRVKNNWSYPRINKKQSDFYELKFNDIQNRYVAVIEQLSQISYQQLEIKPQTQMQDIKIDRIEVKEKKQDQEVVKANSNQILQQQQQLHQNTSSAQQLRGVKLTGVVLERIEMTMESQQISQADLLGQITLMTEFPSQLKPFNVPAQLIIEDDRWHDRSKFQIMKNPNQMIEYSQQPSQQTQHLYITELKDHPQTVMLQYKMNPQLFKELPMIVMWTQEKGLLHIKYMINKKYKSVSYLAFNIGDNSEQNQQEILVTDEEMKKLRSQQQFIKVDKDFKILRLWLANLKQLQGTIEFHCQTIIHTLSVEVMVKDQLVSDLSTVKAQVDTFNSKSTGGKIQNGGGAALERSSDLQLTVLKRIDPTITKFLFVSTFCSIYENDEATSQWHSLNYEGSLYIAEAMSPQGDRKYMMILLNRKKKDDFIEAFDDLTEFKQNQSYIQYRNKADFKDSPESMPGPCRVIYFSQMEEKDQFLKIAEQVQKVLKELREIKVKQSQEKFFTREQVKETLVSIVQGDKFVDYFYQMLLKKYIQNLKEESELAQPLKTRLNKFFNKEAANISFQEILKQCQFEDQNPKLVLQGDYTYPIRPRQPPEMINFAMDKMNKEQKFEKISQLERGRLMMRFLAMRKHPLKNQYFNRKLVNNPQPESISRPSQQQQSFQTLKHDLSLNNVVDQSVHSTTTGSLFKIVPIKQVKTQRRQYRNTQSLNMSTPSRDIMKSLVDSLDSARNSLDYQSISPRQLNESSSKGQFILPLIPKNLERNKKIRANLESVIKKSTDHMNEVNSNSSIKINTLTFRSFNDESYKNYLNQSKSSNQNSQNNVSVITNGMLSSPKTSHFQSLTARHRRRRQQDIIDKADDQFKELVETIKICDTLIDRNREQRMSMGQYGVRMKKIVKRKKTRKNSFILINSVDHIL